MPYSHHHKDPAPGQSLRNGCKQVSVKFPGEEWSSSLIVSEDSIRNESKPGSPTVLHNSSSDWYPAEKKVPLQGCLSNLSDEVLSELILRFVAGEDIDWDFFQAELSWADRIAEFCSRWNGTVEVNGHLWGWIGSGFDSKMGCIPLNRSEDWEVRPEDGCRLSGLDIYVRVDPRDHKAVEKLAAKISSVWYSDE